jgi:hypothetical protein
MEKELQKLIDRKEIIDKVNEIITNGDRPNWQGIIDGFDNEVVLDYIYHFGEEIQRNLNLQKLWTWGR